VRGATDLEVLPCRSAERARRFPALSEEACLAAMQLVLPDGRVVSGADAVPEILRRVPRWAWLARAFDLPGARSLARAAYGWIARRRLRLSCGLPARAR
jgi:predicted DCC family thiol-disulfide oxidoreductase YuxK